MGDFDLNAALLPSVNVPPALAVDPDEIARQRLAMGLPSAPAPMIKSAVPDISQPGGFRVEMSQWPPVESNPQPASATEAGLVNVRNAQAVAHANANAPMTPATAPSGNPYYSGHSSASALPAPVPTPAQVPGSPPPRAPAPVAGPSPTPAATGDANQQAYSAATNKQEQAIEARSQTEADSARAQALGQMQAVKQFQDQQQADMQFRAQKEQEYATQRQDLEKQTTDLSNQKIDPSRVYKNASTPALIGGAIVSFLSGFQSLKSGKNPALDMINKVINDDIQSQMADIETKKAGLGAKQTLLQQDIAAGHDTMDARLKATALAYDTAMKAVDAQVALMKSPEAIQMGQELKAKLQAQQAQTFEDWQNKKTELAMQQHAQTRADQAQGFQQATEMAKLPGELAAQPLQLQNMAAEAKLRTAEADAAEAKAKSKETTANPMQVLNAVKQTGRVINGVPETVPLIAPGTKQEKADKANEELGKAQSLIDAVQELKEARAHYTFGERITPGSDAYKRLDEAHGRVMDLLKKEMGSRGLPKEEIEAIADRLVGDPAGLKDPTPRWDKLIADTTQGANTYLQSNVDPDARWTPRPLTPPGAKEGDNTTKLPPEKPSEPLSPWTMAIPGVGIPAYLASQATHQQPTPPQIGPINPQTGQPWSWAPVADWTK